ncbi:MAG: hypothetical protein IH802_11835, partial [Nitrospinae bacterium]|nr:hypothetical protein [Nitrospinota bacterium]
MSDEDIAGFCRHFTNPAAVAVLRLLVFGKQAPADIVKETNIDAEAVESAINDLADAGLASRDGDGRVEPLKDAATHFLTLLSLVNLHGLQNGTPEYGDSLARHIIMGIAGDLQRNIFHPPPFDRFSEMKQAARGITLIQALPLSMTEEGLADLVAGSRLPASSLNDAQRDYLGALLEEMEFAVTDLSRITLFID